MTWPVVALKRLVDSRRPVTYGIVQAGPDFPGGVAYIRPMDMTASSGVLDPGALQRTDPAIAAAYSRSTVTAGDLIVSIGPSYGKVMVVPAALGGANLTQGTARVAAGRLAVPRFLFWALQGAQAVEHWDLGTGGATFKALNLEPLAQTPVPLPPLGDQRRVADFLDDQVALLDRAIHLRQSQMVTVAERRRSWLGEVYGAVTDLLGMVEGTESGWTQWPLGKLGRLLAATLPGATPNTDDLSLWADESGVPWVSIGDMVEGGTVAATAKALSPAGLHDRNLRPAPVGLSLIHI